MNRKEVITLTIEQLEYEYRLTTDALLKANEALKKAEYEASCAEADQAEAWIRLQNKKKKGDSH